MKRITVTEWKIDEVFQEPDKDMLTYELGHKEHGGQIAVHGSKDLAEQVLNLLNQVSITYQHDDERSADYRIPLTS